MHRDKFLIIKPTRCTNFWDLFLVWNSTCFGPFLCPSSGVFHCTHSNCICQFHPDPASKLSANLYDMYHCRVYSGKTPDDGQRNCPKHAMQDQDETAVPSWSCSQVVNKPVWHIPLPCVPRKTPDDGQRNCPKHVEFRPKDKFEKSVHLVGFILRKIHFKYWRHIRYWWHINYLYHFRYTRWFKYDRD
jgi:hypothetical protein